MGAAGITFSTAAPPTLVTVMVTGNSWPKAADPEAGKVAARAAGCCTVTCAGFVGSVNALTVVPENVSVAWADAAKLSVPAPVAR